MVVKKSRKKDLFNDSIAERSFLQNNHAVLNKHQACQLLKRVVADAGWLFSEWFLLDFSALNKCIHVYILNKKSLVS